VQCGMPKHVCTAKGAHHPDCHMVLRQRAVKRCKESANGRQLKEKQIALNLL